MSKIMLFASYNSAPGLMAAGKFCFSASPENPEDLREVVRSAVDEDRLIENAMAVDDRCSVNQSQPPGVTVYLVEATEDLMWSEAQFLGRGLATEKLEPLRYLEYRSKHEDLDAFCDAVHSAVLDASKEIDLDRTQPLSPRT